MYTEDRYLGSLIKEARVEYALTQEKLAEKVKTGTRHLMAIENGEGNPGLGLLYRIVRELNIPGDSVFYPERTIHDKLIAEIACILSKCSERSLNIIKATALAALDNEENVLTEE